MEKIYISGRISGLSEEEVTAKFDAAEAKLKAQGYEVVNPLKNGIPNNASWEIHISMDVLLLMGCNAIYLLPDWSLSKGATLEKNLSELTGKKIIYEEAPTFQRIKQAIAEGMGVSFFDIVGRSRGQKHVFARMIFAQHLREEGATAVRIASEMKRNHSTVLYYLKKYPEDYRYTREFKAYVDAVKACLSKD